MEKFFRRLARQSAQVLGSSPAFFLAVAMVVLWLGSGALFDYSDTWQLLINTTTTIVTFLMVILLQYTQNRDSKAVHLKLDELLRAYPGARNALVDLEDMSDEELHRLHGEFRKVHEKAARKNGYKPDDHLE